MGISNQFQEKVNHMLGKIDPEILSYNEEEFWMVQPAYEYVEFFATRKELLNTAIALPLARGLHDGDYRKSTVVKGDRTYRMPYLIHPLMVCKMLIELRIPLSDNELDILLAAALCHDMIEDIPFLEHGKELVIQFHLDARVYDTVKAVSKRRDFTEEEERAHFRGIAENKLAALIKLSDRGNNVEDLYNMSAWKIHEYAGETKKYLFPICDYGKEHYPEIAKAFIVLEDKMRCLTEAAELLVDRYEEEEESLQKQIEALRAENASLREEWKSLWKI